MEHATKKNPNQMEIQNLLSFPVLLLAQYSRNEKRETIPVAVLYMNCLKADGHFEIMFD